MGAGGVAVEDLEQEQVEGGHRVEPAFAPAVARGAAQFPEGQGLKHLREVVTKMRQSSSESRDHDRTRFDCRATGLSSFYLRERCPAYGTYCQTSTSGLTYCHSG